MGTPGLEPAFLDKLEDYFHHYRDNLRKAFRVEAPCIASVELGELLSVPAGAAGHFALRAAFGMTVGTGVMATALTGDEALEEKEPGSFYGEFRKSYEAVKAGAKRIYNTYRKGTKQEKEKLNRDLKRNAETAIFGELFGCVGVSAVAETAIISALGGGVVAWGASLIPTYIIGSAVIASKLAYDEYGEQKVIGRLSLPEAEAEEFAETLGREYSYGGVKRDKKGRMKRAEFSLKDGSRATLSRSKTGGSDGCAIMTFKAPKLRYDDWEAKERYKKELKPLFDGAADTLHAEILQESGSRKHHH